MTQNNSFELMEAAYQSRDARVKANPLAKDRTPRYAMRIDGVFSYMLFMHYVQALIDADQAKKPLPIINEAETYNEAMGYFIANNLGDKLKGGVLNAWSDPYVAREARRETNQRGRGRRNYGNRF